MCAGTYYGQELYKVTLLSIAATIFGQLILRFGYFYWFNKKKEFLVPDAVLAIVYIQSVVWVSVTRTHAHTHIHTHTRARTHTHTHYTHIHTTHTHYTHTLHAHTTRTHTYTHIHYTHTLHTHTHIHTHTRTNTHAHIHTYTYTNTHVVLPLITDWYSSVSLPTTDSSSRTTLPVLCLLLHRPVYVSSSHQAMVPVTAELIFPLLSASSSCMRHRPGIHHRSNVRAFFNYMDIDTCLILGHYSTIATISK